MADNIIQLANLQDAGELPFNSEDALALAYADRHAKDSRYVAVWGRWLHYDGAHWNSDTTLHAFDRARAICREVALESEKPAAVMAAKTVAAVVQLARADRRLAATTEQWDRNPLQLVTAGDGDMVPAATYDLATGLADAPDPLDYVTKTTSCSAAPPGTPHPQWSAFLNRITAGDTELQGFLQRYGYCCTGLTTEHAFVFAYGTGANGKSTFINTITRILGDYVAVADMGTFIASTTERHPTDLAKLRGARLVVAQETQKGRRWDEVKIKALTGGDRLTARFMRQDFFDFVPTFKLFIAGNHKPRIGSVDEAMRRRLLLAPFTVRIPAGERDPELAEKLWGERTAILRWCLDGCLQTGSRHPPAYATRPTNTSGARIRSVSGWKIARKTPMIGPSRAWPICLLPGKRGARNATSSQGARWRCRACSRIAVTQSGGKQVRASAVSPASSSRNTEQG
jgi:putative DNA primase/helicase